MFSNYNYNYITLKAGFEFFHVSYRNMGPNFEHSDPESLYDFGTTPIGSLDLESSLQHPKYFALTDTFPYIQDIERFPGKGLSKYTTFNCITLALLGMSDHPDEKEEQAMTKMCDGWLRYDDPGDWWYECYLFEPWKHVSSGVEITPNFEAVQYKEYPLEYRLIEMQKLVQYKE